MLRGSDIVFYKEAVLINALAQERGIAIIDKQFNTRQELNKFLLKVDPKTIDLVYMYSDTFIAANSDIVLNIARQFNRPVVSSNYTDLSLGAVLSYGVDFKEAGVRAAEIAYQVLIEKIDPGAIPTHKFTDFKLGLNEKAAKSLGIIIPRSLREKADYIID